MIGASLADEPRHQRSHQRQPNVPQHSVSTTVKINIFFMTRTPIETNSFHRRAPARKNSTPPSALGKRNIVVFRQQFAAGLVERIVRAACARYANGIAAPAATRCIAPHPKAHWPIAGNDCAERGRSTSRSANLPFGSDVELRLFGGRQGLRPTGQLHSIVHPAIFRLCCID